MRQFWPQRFEYLSEIFFETTRWLFFAAEKKDYKWKANISRNLFSSRFVIWSQTWMRQRLNYRNKLLIISLSDTSMLSYRVLFQTGHANINKTWGLVVLLMSKMAGHGPATLESEVDAASGILKSQRMLAEAVETTCSANSIHRDGILNMQHLQYAGISKKSLAFDWAYIDIKSSFLQICHQTANWSLEIR